MNLLWHAIYTFYYDLRVMNLLWHAIYTFYCDLRVMNLLWYAIYVSWIYFGMRSTCQESTSVCDLEAADVMVWLRLKADLYDSVFEKLKTAAAKSRCHSWTRQRSANMCLVFAKDRHFPSWLTTSRGSGWLYDPWMQSHKGLHALKRYWEE